MSTKKKKKSVNHKIKKQYLIILNFKNFCSLKGTIKKQAVEGQLSATHLTNKGLITSKVYKELP